MSEQIRADAEVFRRILAWRKYREQATHVFSTDHALRWFIRKHGPALQAGRALPKLPTGTFIDPVPFSAMALQLMRGDSPAALVSNSEPTVGASCALGLSIGASTSSIEPDAFDLREPS